MELEICSCAVTADHPDCEEAEHALKESSPACTGHPDQSCGTCLQIDALSSRAEASKPVGSHAIYAYAEESPIVRFRGSRSASCCSGHFDPR